MRPALLIAVLVLTGAPLGVGQEQSASDSHQKESLNFVIGDPSHAEGRWQNVRASLNAIRRAVGVA